MDKLKQHLEQHKAEMDVDLPPESVWQNIQAESGRQTEVKRFPVFMRYAAAVLLITIAAGVWVVTTKKGQPQVVRMPETENPTQHKAELVLEKKANETQSKATEQTVSVTFQETPLPKRNLPSQSKLVIGDVAAIGKSYANLIAYQTQRLRTTPVYVESPDYFTGFVGQLSQMDKDEEEIKGDIERYGINDQLLEGLINIYQQKLNLLKSLRKEIRQMNNAVKGQSNTDSLRPYYLNL